MNKDIFEKSKWKNKNTKAIAIIWLVAFIM